MSTTSTHDTKRGEDLRARLNVLSELPKLWQQQVERWSQLNDRHKSLEADQTQASQVLSQFPVALLQSIS